MREILFRGQKKELENTTPELKPCPFCGGKVELEDISSIDENYFMIQCVNTECGASTCFGDYSTTEQGVAEYWNRRVKDVNNQTQGADSTG